MFPVSQKVSKFLTHKDVIKKLLLNELSSTSNAHNKEPRWIKSINEAEKIAGHPTSYLALKTLFSDDIPNISAQLKVLLNANHPLISTGKKVIYEGRNGFQRRGLLVLLISKATNNSFTGSKERSQPGTISHRQRSLAEITEMLYAAQLVHKEVVNVGQIHTEEVKDLEFGNKMSILMGDYVIANACRNLSALWNPSVVEIISSTHCDFVESEFIEINLKQKYPLCSIEEWKEKSYLNTGSLLAKSCQASAMLAGHSLDVQNLCFQFGKNMGLSWQVYNEMEPFIDNYNPTKNTINLTSAPVIYHNNLSSESPTESNHELIRNSCNHQRIHQVIKDGSALEKCENLYRNYIDTACQLLREFKQSDATRAIENIALSQKSL